MGIALKNVSEAILKTPNASDYPALVARNAVMALRVPPDDVLAAMHGCLPDMPDKWARHYALQVWQRAIDQILK